MKLRVLLAGTLLAFAPAAGAVAPAPPLGALARMPVKEITVFKDGTAFVLHEGRLPADTSGEILMDYLPTPILGTFWVYSTDRATKVNSVSAKQRRVLVGRTALNIRDLIEANPGADVVVVEKGGARYEARILGIPTRSSAELESTSPPNTGERLPEEGNIVLLKTADGTVAVPFDQILTVAFKSEYKPLGASEEFRNLLTVRMDWPGGRAGTAADMGMIYAQRGVRWIPSYKVDLDGKGNAAVKLQATLINDMADLDDVTLNLVVGVPTFAFADQVDPMALQQAAAQVSEYMRRDSSTAFGLSNAIMTQAGYAYAEAPGGTAAPANPSLGGSDRREDLFVFTVNHVTLKKGERLVLPISERTLKYRDVYTLDLSFAPPPELRETINTSQQAEIARLLAAPKVMHKVRLTNTKEQPLTTAPALILSEGKVLAQGLMTYTAVGAETDLAITPAVDISVKREDHETERIPNAETWQGNAYGRINLDGSVTLTNRRDVPVDLEVQRDVLGTVDSADHDGKTVRLNPFDDPTLDGSYPSWWGYYNWPYWWSHFNPASRITWRLTLPANQSADLKYTWHYFWR